MLLTFTRIPAMMPIASVVVRQPRLLLLAVLCSAPLTLVAVGAPVGAQEKKDDKAKVDQEKKDDKAKADQEKKNDKGDQEKKDDKAKADQEKKKDDKADQDKKKD